MDYLVPKGERIIGSCQFSGRDDLVRILIPSSVEEIRAAAFYNCRNLSEVILEDGSLLKSIGRYAFQNCRELKTICLGERIRLVGAHAFWHCTKLPQHIVFPDSIRLIEPTAFFNTKIREVSLPNPCEYQEVNHGFPYSPSFPEECRIVGGTGADFCSTIQNGFPRLELAGETHNLSSTPSCDKNTGEDLLVPEGTEVIESNQFESRDDLVEISIPSSVVKIGVGAFYACKNLRRVKFERQSELKIIDPFAFQNCINLEFLELTDGLRQINAHSFWACEQLGEVVFPESLENIDASSFFSTKLHRAVLPKGCKYQKSGHGFPYEPSFPDGCEVIGGKPVDYYEHWIMPIKLGDKPCHPAGPQTAAIKKHSLIIPEGTKRIAANQFAKRVDFTEVKIPASVEVIDPAAFYLCVRLKRISFESGSRLKLIANYAFQNCFNLSEVALPETTEVICSHSFWSCFNLRHINLPASLRIIDAAAFFTTGISNVAIPENCRYQSSGHAFPYEASFPEGCKQSGGIPCDLYSN